MRADQALVLRGIAATRSQAQRLLAAGGVHYQVAGAWKTLLKGTDIEQDTALRLSNAAELQYVSRGGLKLAGAIAKVGLSLKESTVLDVGQSTGGFTDCVLQLGASHVVGVDVGHGQLANKLRDHVNVVCIEGVNARQLNAEHLGKHLPPAGFDLIVGDVSFISMTLVLPQLPMLLAASGKVLFLIKPQFELQAQDIGRGGIVRDPQLYIQVEQRIRQACALCGLAVIDYFASSITGGDGNHEFFVYAQPVHVRVQA